MKKSILKLIAISGMLIAMNTDVKAQSWSLTGNTGTTASTNFIGTTDNVALRFRTKNVNRMTINATGNVGIGTTTPTAKLHLSVGGFDAYQGLAITNTNTGGKTISINQGTMGKLNFTNPGVLDLMTLDFNTGNVGIGTTTPAYKLHINGAAEGISIQGTSNTVNNNAYMTFRNSAAIRIGYVGDGGTGDNDILIGADIGNVVMNTSAGRVLTATNTGNVGIGTSTPISPFHIQKTLTGTPITTPVLARFSNSTINGNTKIILGSDNSSADGFSTFSAGSSASTQLLGFGVGNAGNTVTQLNLNGDGNVGIGTTNPTQNLHIERSNVVSTSMVLRNTSSNISYYIATYGTTGAGTYWAGQGSANTTGIQSIGGPLITGATNGLLFSGSLTAEHMRITASGNVGIGTTTPGHKLDVYSSNNFAIYGQTDMNSGNGVSGICNVGGGAYGIFGESSTGFAGFFSGPTYCSSGVWSGSDERLKENIQPFQNALYKVMKLEVKNYNFKSEYDNMNLPKGKQTGFIAQELETVFPELVKKATDKSDRAEPFEFKAVNYTGMIPVLTAAIQEQQRKIESLEAALSQCCSNYSTQKNDAGSSAIPSDKASLEQNAPNPFSDETTIHFYLPSNSTAVLKVMTLEGNQVLAEQISKPGYGEVRISGSTMVAGTYTYTLIVNGKAVESKIMVLTK